jgi:hypothetical protein
MDFRRLLRGGTKKQMTCFQVPITLIGGRKMKSIFSALALLYVAATASAVWSSATASPARRHWLLLIAWLLTAVELAGTGSLFWILRDGLGPDSVTSGGTIAISRFAKSVWFPFVIIVLAPALCSFLGRAKRKEPILERSDLP